MTTYKTSDSDGTPFGKLMITPFAREKANLAVHALWQLTGRPTEHYAFLLATGAQPNLVSDLYFPANQHNTGAHTSIRAEDVVASAREIMANGYRVAGWCHAHPGFSTNPSSIDIDNNSTVLEQLAASNTVVLKDVSRKCGASLEAIVENQKSHGLVRIRTESRYVPEVTFEIKKGGIRSFLARAFIPNLMLQNLRMRIPHVVGYSFSLVVNGTEGQEYSAVSYVTNCGFCNLPPQHKTAEVPLETAATSAGVHVDVEALTAELREKVVGGYAGQIR